MFLCYFERSHRSVNRYGRLVVKRKAGGVWLYYFYFLSFDIFILAF
nr:MAG TPA: hypothetical protein [Bacteriophage sp.]